MHNFLASRRIIWFFLGVGVLAIVAIVATYSANLQKQASLQQQLTPQPKFEVTKQDINASKLPEKFPTDFPIEAGAKVTQNYQATTQDGRQQSTRVFETVKSLDDNLKIYQDYFQKNKWTINNTQSTLNYRSILATKNGLLIQVAIDENPTTHVKTVNITAIPQAPAVTTAAPAPAANVKQK